MSNQHHEDDGTIVALLDRFRLQRLPAALAIKKKVDAGAKLEDADIEFFTHVFADARDIAPIAARHPELNGLLGEISALYRDITAQALRNEQKE